MGSLTGDISRLSKLVNMKDLNLYECRRLTGDISELSKLVNMKSLNLEGCYDLTGEITGPIVRWLSGIKEKNLNGCGKLTLASDLSDIADMTHVDLSNMNSLTGDISSLSKLVNMKDLNLYECRSLTGDISSLSKLVNIKELNLYYCEGLTGEITGPIVRWLSGIKEKNLNGCGKLTLASDLSDIADMTHVDLSNMNSLTGDISELSKLDKLEKLDLTCCKQLTGTSSRVWQHTSVFSGL